MLPVPVSLSWDSFLVSFFLRSSEAGRSHRYCFSAALGIFDALASWSAVHAFTNGWPQLGARFLFAWIFCILLCGVLAVIRFRFSAACLYTLPVLLCLDNLASPAAQPSFLSALIVGATSAAMSALGFSVAGALKTPLRKLFCFLPPAMRFLP
jgi:hypothetical protein